jgi:hypothetical protein
MQFVVHDSRQPFQNRPERLADSNRRDLLKLDLDVLTLSAERIKQALNRELNLSSTGERKIHLFLESVASERPDIRVVAVFYTDGWQYRVSVPERLEQPQLVRGIINVLLLEFANRGAGPKSAEIPLWLSEGVSARLLASFGPELTFTSPPKGWMERKVRVVGGRGDPRGADPLREARNTMSSFGVLSFASLAHPSAENLSEENLKSYQCSAHVFYTELVRLAGGRNGIVMMLKELPWCWNWETAMLRAFGSRFQALLDVEKWWSVNVIAFTGRDASQIWPLPLCLQRLDDLLVAPAQVRLATNSLPVRTQTSLQELIIGWDFSAQQPILQKIVNQLTSFKYSSPNETLPLIEAYRSLLTNYLRKRVEVIASINNRLYAALPIRVLQQETVRQLDELFRQREVLRRQQISAVSPAARN